MPCFGVGVKAARTAAAVTARICPKLVLLRAPPRVAAAAAAVIDCGTERTTDRQTVTLGRGEQQLTSYNTARNRIEKEEGRE